MNLNVYTSRACFALCLSLVAVTLRASGQADLPIYTDRLVNGFQDWSWGTRNLNNASPVHTGTRSISANFLAWEGLSFEHPDFNVSPYTNLSFWVNGGNNGGQRLQVFAEYGTSSAAAYLLPPLAAATWVHHVLPLSSLGVANATNVNRFNLQLTSFGTTNAFYVDDIQLDAAPAPAIVHIAVNTTNLVRAADPRWFSLNAAIWDSYFDTAATSNLLRELGTYALRLPGGSLSDEYHWATGKSLTNTWAWVTSWANFLHVITNGGLQTIITVNYGTGTSNEAAAWVKSANVTNECGVKYWEIGNECYGSWETDSNNLPHDPYTYAVRAANYMALMKAADSTIKIGVVATPGEGSYSNNPTHYAINPRTGTTNYGWTPVMLDTLHQLGVTPDFLVYHVYPQYTGPESDALVLQASAQWASDAADLRRQITDYLGAGTNVELLCTENNSNSGNQGRQSTSLVNALYLADSLGQLMKTEFNALVWWDLRNGADTKGSFDPTIYGWRTNGDLGIILNSNTRYPTFYSYKLMRSFVQPGDTVFSATSDYLLLAAYAARKADGAVNLLVINKDTTISLDATIALGGFTPGTSAAIRSFGIPQDEAARTNGPAQAQDVATNTFAAAAASFNYTFPPLSLTMFTLVPTAPRLLTLPSPAGKFVFQLEGQPSVPYIIQSSTNLVNWDSESTNTLSVATLTVTNVVTSGSARFWRAVWRP